MLDKLDTRSKTVGARFTDLRARFSRLETYRELEIAHAREMRNARMRFLEAYNCIAYGNPSWNSNLIGPEIAAGGNISLDVSLYTEGIRKDYLVFQDIYRVTVEDFTQKYAKYKELYPVFDDHGTIVTEKAGRGGPGSMFSNAFEAVLEEVDLLDKSRAGEVVSANMKDKDSSLERACTKFKQAFDDERRRVSLIRK